MDGVIRWWCGLRSSLTETRLPGAINWIEDFGWRGVLERQYAIGGIDSRVRYSKVRYSMVR